MYLPQHSRNPNTLVIWLSSSAEFTANTINDRPISYLLLGEIIFPVDLLDARSDRRLVPRGLGSCHASASHEFVVREVLICVQIGQIA